MLLLSHLLRSAWDVFGRDCCGFPHSLNRDSWYPPTPMRRGGRRTKDCSQTWSFGFQFRLEKHFSDERGLPFYYLKIGFLEYLRISGEIRYPNGPIGYWKKVTIWKEACIVHVGAVIYDYQGEGASWSKKCHSWKDCPGDLTSLNTDNVNFCTRSRPYQREASRPSGPGRGFFRFILARLPDEPCLGPGTNFITGIFRTFEFRTAYHNTTQEIQ